MFDLYDSQTAAATAVV